MSSMPTVPGEPSPPHAPPTPSASELSNLPTLIRPDGATAHASSLGPLTEADGPPAAESEPTTIGDFQIIRKLGEGGMGAVYLAVDPKLGRQVAIKTMKPSIAARATHRERFEREARAAAAVEHDNIVPIWQVGQSADGSPFIAMPYLRGEMLDTRMKRESPADSAFVLLVARDVAEGLAAAHAKGLIHRDIKPGNIWLEGEPESTDPLRRVRRCKILDFGLARPVEDESSDLTASGMVLGTPAYMAPEQARGEKVDHRVDLFSLGVMLYRLATGIAPFRGPNATAILFSLAQDNPRSVRSLNDRIPQDISDLIARLMEKDPARRISSAIETAETVVRIAQSLGIPLSSGSQFGATLLPEGIWTDSTEDVRPAARASTNRHAQPSADSPSTFGSRRRLLVGVGLLAVTAATIATAVLLLRNGSAQLTIDTTAVDADTDVSSARLQLTGIDGRIRFEFPLGKGPLRIDPGEYQIRIEGSDRLRVESSTVRASRDAPAVVRILPQLNGGSAKVDPKPRRRDEALIRWAWKHEAEVVISAFGSERTVPRSSELPDGDFVVVRLRFKGNNKLSDAALSEMPAAPDLTHLFALYQPLGDPSAEYLARLTTLKELDLGATKITDAALNTLRPLKNIETLHLFNTGTTDQGLPTLAAFPKLKELGLGVTKISDKGLVHLAKISNLEELILTGTSVTDSGMAAIRSYPKLTTLSLDDTKISDKGLMELQRITQLRSLRINDTAVTAEGVDRFRKAVPECSVVWNGAKLAPSADPQDDRRLAIHVLQLGGRVTTDRKGSLEIAKSTDLPAGEFKLTGIMLTDNKAAGPADFKRIAGALNLTRLSLERTRFTDSDCEHFRNVRSLRELRLTGTSVTEDGLGYFRQNNGMKLVDLSHTNVSGRVVSHFFPHMQLESLNLEGCRKFDPTAIQMLRNMRTLRTLDLGDTRLNPTDIQEVANAIPACTVRGNGGLPVRPRSGPKVPKK